MIVPQTQSACTYSMQNEKMRSYPGCPLKLNTALIAKTKNRKMGKTKKEKLSIYRGTAIQPLFALNPGSTIGYAV